MFLLQQPPKIWVTVRKAAAAAWTESRVSWGQMGKGCQGRIFASLLVLSVDLMRGKSLIWKGPYTHNLVPAHFKVSVNKLAHSHSRRCMSHLQHFPLKLSCSVKVWWSWYFIFKMLGIVTCPSRLWLRGASPSKGVSELWDFMLGACWNKKKHQSLESFMAS